MTAIPFFYSIAFAFRYFSDCVFHPLFRPFSSHPFPYFPFWLLDSHPFLFLPPFLLYCPSPSANLIIGLTYYLQLLRPIFVNVWVVFESVYTLSLYRRFSLGLGQASPFPPFVGFLNSPADGQIACRLATWPIISFKLSPGSCCCNLAHSVRTDASASVISI